ncbi:hypothetical protein PINS_up022995 [Pythium insidiosum]|nr:hypothetical protein PINS_up022995 [Pythium insidiosum]
MEKSVEALLKAGGLGDDRAVAKEEHDELVQKKIRNNQNRKEQEKAREQLRQLDPELAKQLDAEIAEKRAEEANDVQARKHVQSSCDEERSCVARCARMNSDDEDDMSDSGDDEADGHWMPATRLQRRLERQAGALVTEIDDDGAKAEHAKGPCGSSARRRDRKAEKAAAGDQGEDTLLSEEISSTRMTRRSPRQKKQKTDVKVTEKDKAAVAKALPQGALQTSAGLSARASGAIAVDLGNGASSAVGVEKAASDRRHGTARRLLLLPRTNPCRRRQSPSRKRKTNPGKKHKKKKNKGKQSPARSTSAVLFDAPDQVGGGESQSKAKDDSALNIAEAAATASRCAQEAQGRRDNRQRHAVEVVQDVEEPQTKKSKTDELSQTSSCVARSRSPTEDENEIAAGEGKRSPRSDTNAKKGAEIAKPRGHEQAGVAGLALACRKSYRQKVREETAKKLAEDTKKQVLEARLDSKMERVLINEKKDKRAPSSRCRRCRTRSRRGEEYEMAMRNPLGQRLEHGSVDQQADSAKLIKRARPDDRPAES